MIISLLYPRFLDRRMAMICPHDHAAHDDEPIPVYVKPKMEKPRCSTLILHFRKIAPIFHCVSISTMHSNKNP